MEEAGSDDRISGLPDDLLRDILLRLRSLPAAARTSILSRRWRHLWTSFPELVIDELHAPGRPPSSFLRAVEGALAAYSASNVDVAALTIAVPDVRFCRIEARRVSSWLRVASERVAGTLSVTLPRSRPATHGGQEIELPPCGRATEIALSLADPFVLRLRPAASFAALTVLTIQSAAMDGRELGAFVSSMCPRLTDLTLRVNLVACSDVSIRSASLRRLEFDAGAGYAQRLAVAAPMLEALVASFVHHAHVSAQRLAEAKVQRLHRHHFADDVPRRLRRLDATQLYLNAAAPPRVRRFDAVDELRLSALIGMEGYTSFLDDVNNFPVCESVLSISLTGGHHGFVPTMLHLLRRSNGIRKLVLESYTQMKEPCSTACPCRLPESYRADDMTLDSLEEIEINTFMGADDQVEFLELLVSRCSATRPINVVLNKSYLVPLPTEKVSEMIHSISRPNLTVGLH
ncbi:hypothetical protein D1007_07069 [Hordeum vulgare]|nr:hypothetical protein D1007_07069 [Hordeum vulgare]